jgi:hypothetical protein
MAGFLKEIGLYRALLPPTTVGGPAIQEVEKTRRSD